MKILKVKISDAKIKKDVSSSEGAPFWAHFRAIDANGDAFWYDRRPDRIKGGWMSTPRRQKISGGNDTSNWENSVVERPRA